MLENFWYIGCGTWELEQKPVARTILGKSIAIFRDERGRASAVLDRCCHRGFPLSRGKSRQGRIICGYHGWEFNGAGQCVKIPSQEPTKKIPSSFCVPNFPCEEHDGYVWIWLGGDKRRPPAPRIPEFASGHWIQGSRSVACHFTRALEITYSASHIYYVHPWHPATVAASKRGLVPVKSELRVLKEGCVVFGPPTPRAGDPIPGVSQFRLEFSLPGRIHLKLRTRLGMNHLYYHAVPETESSCRMHWLLANLTPKKGDPQVVPVNDGKAIIEEDQEVLELVERTYQSEGEGFEKSVEADIPSIMMRKIIRLAEGGRWKPANLKMPKRRVLSIMGLAGEAP